MKIRDMKKTINCSTKYFIENDLDAFFLATNAPAVTHVIVSSTGWLNLAKN